MSKFFVYPPDLYLKMLVFLISIVILSANIYL